MPRSIGAARVLLFVAAAVLAAAPALQARADCSAALNQFFVGSWTYMTDTQCGSSSPCTIACARSGGSMALNVTDADYATWTYNVAQPSAGCTCPAVLWVESYDIVTSNCTALSTTDPNVRLHRGPLPDVIYAKSSQNGCTMFFVKTTVPPGGGGGPTTSSASAAHGMLSVGLAAMLFAASTLLS